METWLSIWGNPPFGWLNSSACSREIFDKDTRVAALTVGGKGYPPVLPFPLWPSADAREECGYSESFFH